MGVPWDHIGAGSVRCGVGNVCSVYSALAHQPPQNKMRALTKDADSVVLWEYLSWITPLVFETPNSYFVPVHCGLTILGLTYQAILAFDALHVKNNVQVYAICICNIVLFVSNIMRIGQTAIVLTGLREARSMGIKPTVDLSVDLWKLVYPVLITSSVLVGACSLGIFAFAYKLHKEFAWAIYRHVSGSRQTRRRFLTYKARIFP
jgi:hypothetical protein